MDIGRLIKDWKQIMLFACGFFALIYFLSTTSHFVTAFEETKRAHVLPKYVTADGWSNPDNALFQDLPPDAPFGSFNQGNSAFVLLSAGSSSVPLQSSTGDGHAPGPTPVEPSPPSAPAETVNQPTTSPVPEVPSLLESPAATAPEVLPMPQVTTPADVPTLPVPVVDPVPANDAPTSMLENAREVTVQSTSRFFASIADIALATTTDEIPESVEIQTQITSSSTLSQEVADVPTCSVLVIPCHTINFSGFTVSGALTEKKFQGAELNFSFGNRVPENELADSKLQVRFYHKGQWKMAGEIFLNKELSNASNGAYFTAHLDGIDAWDDFSDVKVVFEFVRGDERVAAAAYLDSIWVDAIYRDRAQEILNGKAGEIPDDTPDNVLFRLPNESDVSKVLLMQNGQRIYFPYLSSLSKDQLVIRAEKPSYKKSDGAVYVSITNSGDTEDSFKLFSSFPGGSGSVLEVAQYMKNVPTSATSSVTSDVTYLCEGGWKQNASSTDSASSSAEYLCSSTGESQRCSWLNDFGDNCKVSGVAVATSTAVSYGEDWVAANQSLSPESDSVVTKRLPPGYSLVSAVDTPIRILPGQTVYFRINLSSPDSVSKRFVLSAKGNRYFGALDSVRLKNEDFWKNQTKTRKELPRMRVNDELSEKNDFDVNETPSFHFKFKTQRSFFRRVFDNLAGRTIPYAVSDAQLRHESGSIERVPVEIEYGSNDEWTLRIKKGQRAFRPGRYTVDLSMNEGGTALQDSIQFYWGVIAINPDKSSYKSDETVHFSIAALDNNGDTVCDAQMQLTITAPSGATQDVPVVSGGGCGHNNITTLPDYVADYTTSDPGEYTLVLSKLDDTGAIESSVTDSFSVVDAPFVITRDGPTRIYPVSAYSMKVIVAANQSFNGRVVETLPEGFSVSDAGGARVIREDGVLHLTWDMSLGAGESREVKYIFKAPEVTPYLFLAGPIRLVDPTLNANIFEESRTWKIASDALLIATGVAWLNGTTTTNGTEINNGTAAPINWTADDYDTTYYTHSTTTNNTRLTVNVAGDYLVAITVPTERTDNNNTVVAIEADIRVNGVKQNLGVGRSNSTNRSTQLQSSDHLSILLHNLSAGDYIEVDTRAVTTVSGANTVVIGTQASLYAEYIPTAETVFTAVATTTTSGTNINPTATSSIVWYDVGSRVDSGYTHFNGPSTTAANITLASQSDYMVHINIPDDGAVTNMRPRARVLLGGTMVNGGDFKQGYIANSNAHTAASMHWSGVIHATTTNSNLSVVVQQASAVGTATVNADQASIYIQKLPTTDLYFGRATTTSSGTNWNPAASSSILWQADDLIDTGSFSHSTGVNSQNITVQKAGDYLLTYNDSLNGAVARAAPRVSAMVNGVMVSGALAAEHFVRSPGGGTDQESSGSLVYLLRNLNINDIISLQTVQNTVTGTMLADQNALLLLWRKVAQSSFIQDTQRWYANTDAQTPVDEWPGGPGLIFEGDSITTGNAATSSTVLRLRMALKANVTTSAGADTFKLQYAAGSTCGPALTWTDVGAAGSGSIWRGYDNTSVTGGSTISTQLLSVSSTSETYEEQNPTAATPNGITGGQDGEWDWALQDNGAPDGTSYCFRMVQSSGQVLKDYLDYPQLITNNVPDAPTLLALFDNEKATTTSPWFTFAASDDNGDDIQYQIQVSTDPTFASTVIDANSLTNVNDFENIQSPSDRTPFNAGETVRYKSIATLTNGTTYWWRVRGLDPKGTTNSGSWSTANSFTIDTSVLVSTWFQTTSAQFANDSMTNLTATDTVMLTGANTTGSLTSQAIAFSSHVLGNSWGTVTWNDQHVNGTILYQVEYFTSTSSWALIPDTDLTGNAAGTSTQPISLANLDPTTYGTIRIKANFTKGTASPVLNDWTVSWAYSVERPTLTALFDNEKTATTSPSFKFYTTDPESNDLVYQIQWSTDSTFTTGVTTRTSDSNAGFSNITSVIDTSPFTSGNTIQYSIQPADVLANNATYWWRVRAKDPPPGGNAYSFWSTARSFTTDTTVAQSTWFQTTSAQFTIDTLTQSSVVSNSVSGNTDVGKIAIYRAAAAGEFMSTATYNHTFDTTVRQDDIYSMQFASSSIKLKSGYYAVVYGSRFNATSTTNRSEVQTNLSLASTTLPIGWSQAFIRRNLTANQGFSSGGGIINVANDNDALVLQSFRTDTNPTATLQRAANDTGISIVKLDRGWDYLRLSKTGTQVGPTNANWVSVTYDREDEVDTTAYSHTSGSASVTLKSTGHYLVFANTYGSLTTGVSNATAVDQRLILGGVEVPGSYTTVFMQGNAAADGVYQGAASIGMIIESTTTNQTLSVQVSRGAGTSAWRINAGPTGAYVDRTAITIVKIPEGDFIRLQNAPSVTNLNPAATTTLPWSIEAEEDTASFSHSTTTNPSRVTSLIAADYLFLSANFASPGTTANANWGLFWEKNATLLNHAFGGAYNTSATSHTGAFSGIIMPSAINGDFFEAAVKAYGTAGNVLGTKMGLQAVRISSLNEADTNPKSVTSTDIVFSSGDGPKWESISWNDTTPVSTDIIYQVKYLNASSTYVLVPDNAGFGGGYINSVGTTTSPIDISGLNRVTYGTLKLVATFTCAGGSCPSLNDWTVKWNPGISVSGIAKQFDQTTNVTSGTVNVAVNGVLSTKTGSISGGTWTVSGVNAYTGDIIEVFVAGASTSTRAVAVTKYTGTGNVTGMKLYQMHLTLGSDDQPFLTNADIGKYDNTVSGNSAVFFSVVSNNLNVCAVTNCLSARLLVNASTTYEPAGNITTPNIQIDGTLFADGNTLSIGNSWKNNAAFFMGTSTVLFTATSTSETIDSSTATTSAFNIVTLGQTSGTATWTLGSGFNASSTFSLSFGTLKQGGANELRLGGDLTIGASGSYIRSSSNASTTFMGTATSTWTDSSAAKQDMGTVVVLGNAKGLSLGSNVRATNVVNSGVIDVTTSNFSIDVLGNWNNTNSFMARSGTVNFVATTTGRTITPGLSTFFNLAFNGAGGNWAFSGSYATSTNDFTITTGTVTLPVGTTTVGGSFSNAGTFQHNNGAVLFNSTASGKTITPGASSFYDLNFNGSGGAWAFSATATTSRNFIITVGTVSAPANTMLTVAGSFAKNGGSFTHNNGTLRFTGVGAQTIKLNNSDAYNILFNGVGGTWAFVDTNATSTASVTFQNGTTTLPTGSFAVGRDFTTSSGGFLANGGTVRLTATTTGFTINPGISLFSTLLVDSSVGGWTMSSSATTTSNMFLNAASSFTLSSGKSLQVLGQFTTSVATTSTTWTGSTLFLSATSTATNAYSLNTKGAGAATYGTLLIGTTTNVRMWNSSASVVTTLSGGSLYSQNHGAVSGSLTIFGTYVRSSGSDFWSYANDFDGATMGNPRAVTVRVATSSTLSFTGGTLNIVGISTASTTVTNTGTNTYSWSISGGSLNAQYYQVRNTDATGLSISGTPTITSMADGDFLLSINGGTTMTVASTAINVNPLLQILRVKFATTTAITGFNVAETGTASSNWWFRSSYGNLTGENFDNDPSGPTGDPGPIQWDDSGFHINISGHVYSDHGTTPIGNPPCDGVTPVVKIVTSIGNTYSATCDAGTGAYSVSSVSFPASAIIYAYLDTNGGKRAVTMTKSATVDITNFDLYQNAVVIRQEDVTPLNVSDMTFKDATFDSDIPYNASSTLIVSPDTELFVSSGKAFAPGATTTLLSGGSGSVTDGRLYLATNAIFTESGQQALNIGGGLFFDTGSAWSGASTTVTFTATTTGKSIQTASPISIWNLAFNGPGGQWSMDNGFATTTARNSFAMTAGTLIGRGDVAVMTGGIGGSGTITMTGGMFKLDGTGSIGNSNPWQFYNLRLGTTSASTITKTGTGTTTVNSVFSITANATLNAGSSPWVLVGGGTPFSLAGTFNVQNAPWYYVATSSTNVTATTYGNLFLQPAAAGSPTFTLGGGTITTFDTTVGDGTNPVSVTANTNDPSITMNGSMSIRPSSTYIASDIGALNVARNWTNAGAFTHSSAAVLFNATTTGWTIDAGQSNFFDLTFNGTGGWTVSQNASSSRNTTITNAGNFTLASGKVLAVLGTFTNSVGGAATTWTGSTLYLNTNANYTIDTKSAGGDMYGTLLISTTTKIRSWNSAATTTTVLSGGSWYSMNHASSSGALSIYGTYTLSSGTDFWDYRTDFDGVDIAGSPRKVDVSIASSTSVSYTGTGALEMVGATTASTTVQNQGAGAYSFSLSGASTTMQYFEFRNVDATGVSFSGSPTFNTFSNGDFLLSATSGSAMTLASSVIDANPLKVVRYMKFATTTAIGGFNVTETGTPSTGQYWKFNLHYGNLAGESFDNDPGPSAGDPGYVRWDNSNIGISVSGRVYSDEGTTVSTVCDNTTSVVVLKVQGVGAFSAPCNSSTGVYTIPGVTYNPGDSFIVYLDTNGGRRGTTVSRDPGSNISDFDIYENRVIARSESATALTISDMDQYDSGQDSDIPFIATVSGTNTLVLPSNTKLIVWSGKTFAPGGNVTLNANATANPWDGTLEVFANGTFTAASNQVHTIGGSFLIDTNATFTPGNSTVTFTASSSGKTITPNTSSFYHLTFNGSGGNWAFAGGFATTTGNFTITAGTVTLPTGTTTVTGSFSNNGGTIQHNNSTVLFNATTTGKTVKFGGSDFYNAVFNSSAGSWTFTDTNATTSNNLIIDAGAVTMPTGIFSIGSSMSNAGTMTANNGTVRFTSPLTGKSLRAGQSSFYNLTFNGVGGSWSILDASASTTRDLVIATGTVSLPSSLGIGGSFSNTGLFTANTGTVTFTATTTGFTINPGSSSFYNLNFNSAAGGWTVSANATSSNNTTLASAASFTQAAGTTLAVQGVFTNQVGGAPTTWANSTLFLASGSYTINSKSTGGDAYGTILLGTNAAIRSWNSSVATTTVGTNASLYSQNDSGTSGALNVYGTFTVSTGSENWSYATDFDGTALGGSSRQVSVKIATSSSVTLSAGTLNIVGITTATTTITTTGTSGYSFNISGGAINARYYQFKGMDSNGVTFTGTPVISSLDYGDMELSVASGTTMTLAGTVIDANSDITIIGMRFASTSANTRGYNVMTTGSPATFWTFTGHYGNIAGESFDGDGSGACGHLRWDDSSCLFVNQAHYRWRNDDGNEGALSSAWFNVSWAWRQKIVIRNQNATAYTNIPVKIDVPYDSAMKSNFDDLRFTDSSGTTSISFWRENTVTSSTSTVWVKVPSLPASGYATIYVYFGNSGASVADDGANTLNFLEDFESNSLAGYTFGAGDSASFETTSSFAHNGTYGIDAPTGHKGDRTTAGMYKTGSQTAQGKTIRYFQYVDSSQQDEACTLFAVGGSGNNYAVCLDEFPSQAIEIAKNVTSNDGSGTVLASTAVTFSTGWYEVVIDWLTTNAINVNVYDSTGALFQNISTTDSSHTSAAGYGFAFWSQNGGWDTYMVKPYTAITPSYLFGGRQANGGATWKANEDTVITGLQSLQNVRLRFSIQNTGSNQTNQQYRLQYAAKGGAANCESVPTGNFLDVPTTSGGCGSDAACMKSSSQFTNLASTSPSLTYPGTMKFTAGNIMQDPSNQTIALALNANTETETEYNFQITNSATQSSYCFRTSNGGTDLANYDRVAEATIAYTPFITNPTINSGVDIALTEGASTTVYATSTVTDNNGFADMVSATGTIYRSGVAGGADCTASDNSCYQIASTSCSFTSCSGNSCTLQCRANIQYFAEPTDTGTFAAETWKARLAVQDSGGLRDTQSSGNVELLTLYALAITTGDIDFGALNVGADTGSIDATTTLANTGNAKIDIQLQGTDLTGGASTIPVGQQKYATSTFTYASCSICQFLTGSASTYDVNIPKPTSTTTPQTSDIYWGISIPNGTGATNYSGLNTFIAVGG